MAARTQSRYGTAAAPGAASRSGLRDFFALLWRRRWWLLIPLLLAGGLALAYGLMRPATYVSSVQILIDPQALQAKSGVMPPSGTASPGVTSGAQAAIVDAQMRLMTSAGILREVVQRERLDKDDEFSKPGGDPRPMAWRWLRHLFGAPRGQSDPQNAALLTLAQNTRAERIAMSYVVNLSVASSDALKSARIANAIADVYLRRLGKLRPARAGTVSQPLSKPLSKPYLKSHGQVPRAPEQSAREPTIRPLDARLRQRLNLLQDERRRAEAALKAFKKRNGNGNGNGNDMADKAAALPIRSNDLEQINAQLIAQQLERARAQSRLKQIMDLKRRGLPTERVAEAMVSETLLQLQDRLAEALSEQAELEETLLPAHPSLREARSKTQALRRLIALELDRLAAAASLELERAKASERELARRQKALSAQVTEGRTAQERLQDLERKAQLARTAYDDFLLRASERTAPTRPAPEPAKPANPKPDAAAPQTRAPVEAELPVARILSPAIPARAPSGLPSWLLLASGLMAGLGIGLVLALLRDKTDNRVFSARRLHRETGLPVLAQMPKLRGLIEAVAVCTRADSANEKAGSLRQTSGGDLDAALPDAVRYELSGAVGATAAGILDQCAASQNGTKGHTVLLVSARGDGSGGEDSHEGAADVALALALQAREGGSKVLLVDGDLRDQRLSRIIGRAANSDLAETASDGRDFTDPVQPVSELGLWLLPADEKLRQSGDNGAKLAGSLTSLNAMSHPETQSGTSKDFDWIIIDGGTTRNSLLRALLPLADDILLVVHRGLTTMNDVNTSKEWMRQHWQNLRGAILAEPQKKLVLERIGLATGPKGYSQAGATKPSPSAGNAKGATAFKAAVEAAMENERQGRSASHSAAAAYRAGVNRGKRNASVGGGGGTAPASQSPPATQSRPATQLPPATQSSPATTTGGTLSASAPPFAAIPDLASGRPAQRVRQGLEARGLTPPRASFGDMMSALRDDGRSGDGGERTARAFQLAVYDMLRKLLKSAEPDQSQTVMLLAGHKGAGTSSTALSLAYAAALSGKRSLLVDAFSPDADLSMTFATDLRQDHACVLDSKAHLAELVTRDEGSGLDFLPIALANLDELAAGQRRKLAAGLSKLAADYDVVVIDGGAVLENDAAVDLAACADAVLIVARPGLTLVETIEATGKALGEAGKRLAGVVLARVG